MRTSLAIKGILMAAAAAAPMLCNAESNIQTTSGQTAVAHVDFQITVPKFLFLRVGTGSDYAAGTYSAVGNVDVISWTLSTATLGNGTPVVGTGGDVAGVAETAAIVCNSGNSVAFTSTTTGDLLDATGDSILYSSITVAAAAGTFPTLLNAPGLAAGGGTNTTNVTGAGHVVKADAKWTFSYANNTWPPGGVYGGGGTANVGNGRVTYTATMP